MSSFILIYLLQTLLSTGSATEPGTDHFGWTDHLSLQHNSPSSSIGVTELSTIGTRVL